MAAGVLTFSSKSSGPEQDHVTSSFLMQIIIHDSLCLVAQLCPTLCNPTDCSLPGSSVHGDSPAKNTGVGCHALLTQGSNPSLLHCRQNLLLSEPPGKPMNTGVGNLSSLQGIFPTQELNRDLLHCRRILYQLSYEECPMVSRRPLG